jgi:hypothetical protein
MATNTNPFVVNIVDLQNIAVTITGYPTGPAAVAQLQLDVGNLQEMVQYDTKTIAADTITNFTPGNTIQVTTNSNIPSSTAFVYGTVGFGYLTNSLTGGITGSLPITFATSILASGTTITITLNTVYSIANFPNYTGTILWYNGATYQSFPIPNGNYIGNYPYVNFNGTQIIISNLTNSTLTSITPDSTGYSLWLTLTVFN